MDEDDEVLGNFYFSSSRPSAFGGASNLKRYLKKEGKTKQAKQVKKWLSGQDVYTLHKPIIRKFPRRKTIVNGSSQQLQADLLDVKSHAKANGGNKYILTVIDVFSKKAWAIPIKNKTGGELSKALSTLFKKVDPNYLQTDKGKEFFNGNVKSVLKKFNVRHFTTENENIKSSIVERFNRTLRNSLHRYFSKTGRFRYLDVLSDIVQAYNNRHHRSIGMAPNEVNDENEEDVWLRLYDPIWAFQSSQPKLKEGDHVRISKARNVFTRGYTPNWSVEVFTISRVLPTSPKTYQIKDWKGEDIKGSFYQHELQKIQQPSSYKVEKILRKKKIGQKNMVLVKWLGYPDSFNQWIPESDVTNNN